MARCRDDSTAIESAAAWPAFGVGRPRQAEMALRSAGSNSTLVFAKARAEGRPLEETHRDWLSIRALRG